MWFVLKMGKTMGHFKLEEARFGLIYSPTQAGVWSQDK